MKEKYVPATLEVIKFDIRDVITSSNPQHPTDNNGGNGIGGGYNPGGWT